MKPYKKKEDFSASGECDKGDDTTYPSRRSFMSGNVLNSLISTAQINNIKKGNRFIYCFSQWTVLAVRH